MNYDEIIELNDEEVKELYEDILENQNNFLTHTPGSIWRIYCNSSQRTKIYVDTAGSYGCYWRCYSLMLYDFGEIRNACGTTNTDGSACCQGYR